MLYNVKVNGNSNVIVNDIQLRVFADLHPNGVNIDKETYDRSEDLKRLVQSGIVSVTLSGKETKFSAPKVEEDTNILYNGSAFVKEGRTIGIPEGVIVANHNEVVDVEVKPVVEEVKQVDVEVKEDVIAESTNKVEQVSTKTEVKQSTETKAATKTTNKKSNKK